ncbi:MAG TPA: hypothetical protein VNC84_06620 [Gammaproteobacteria bacterium]|jgi:hypothetical protein|nr:hypothetical protein [Gammaproteobacteria bacterium]
MPPKERGEIEATIDEEIWSVYDSNTKIFSAICRKLAFAEGGICWFFKSQANHLPPDIIFILKFLILFFASDALQYFLAATIYWSVGKYYEYCNAHGLIKTPKQVVKQAWMNRASLLLFLVKIVFLVIASYCTIKLLT